MSTSRGIVVVVVVVGVTDTIEKECEFLNGLYFGAAVKIEYGLCSSRVVWTTARRRKRMIAMMMSLWS